MISSFISGDHFLLPLPRLVQAASPVGNHETSKRSAKVEPYRDRLLACAMTIWVSWGFTGSASGKVVFSIHD